MRTLQNKQLSKHFSLYEIIEGKALSQRAIYECKSPQWAQSYAPDTTAGLQYGWTFVTNL
jgi:hypothetical protein